MYDGYRNIPKETDTEKIEVCQVQCYFYLYFPLSFFFRSV